MELDDGFGRDTRFPPPYGFGGFAQWKMMTEVFFQINLEDWFALMEGFEAPKDKNGKRLRPRHWTEEQVQRSEANERVTNILVNLIPNNILCKLGKFKDASELWSKLSKLNESSPVQEEEKAEEEASSSHELEAEVERYSTSEEKVEEEIEVGTSRIEGEERPSIIPEQEECSTSGRDEEPCKESSSIEEGNHISSSKNKDHIICFECREKGHYKNKCPKKVKKKVQLAPKVKEKTKSACTLVHQGKEHVVCYTCHQKGHFQSQCPRGRIPRKDMSKSSNVGGAKVKPKVSFINESSSIYHRKHASNRFTCFSAHDHLPRNQSRIKYLCLGAKSYDIEPKERPKSRDEKLSDKKLGINPKKGRHMPKKKKKAQRSDVKSKFETLEEENQVLKSKLEKLEKTLRKLGNAFKGSNGQDLSISRKGLSMDKKGLGYKPKSKEDKPSYHSVPYSYGTCPRSRSVKVTREVIPRVNLDETTMTKASNKPRRVIRKVSREVIPSEYLVNPRSSNRFWVPKSVIQSH